MKAMPLTERSAGAAPAPEADRRRGIDRVILLLDALLQHRAPMRAGDLARMLNAPRSTTYEIVNRLVEAEILETVGDDGRVYFGRAMHLYGWAYSHNNALYRRIVETLDRLAAETGATAQVCALRGRKYVVVDCRDAPGPFRITSDIGVEVPIPWTASGRLLVGHMNDAAIRDFIAPDDYKLPDGRMLRQADFLSDVAKARSQGYCETTGLADRFTWCMAAPIHSADGIVSMTLCLVLPADTPKARRIGLLAVLRERAKNLSVFTA
jgi:DNA-binding IclR family transcriptional regulator